MARVLRMPTQAELPQGPTRDFVIQLSSLYKEARRPTLRAISGAIPEDCAGTASTETIRRMLRGETVPAQWPTVDAVVTALCQLAGVDPDDAAGGRYGGDSLTRRRLVATAWHEALDNPGIRKAAGSAEVAAGTADAPGGLAARTVRPAEQRSDQEATPSRLAGSGAADAESIMQQWDAILEAVMRERKVAWILLRGATVDSLADGVLTLRFAREGDAKGFADNGHDRALGRVLQEMFGISPQIRAVVGAPIAQPGPVRSGSSRPADDPLASDASGGNDFSDEPPF